MGFLGYIVSDVNLPGASLKPDASRRRKQENKTRGGAADRMAEDHDYKGGLWRRVRGSASNVRPDPDRMGMPP
jgi:hypothetical protein